MIYDLILSEESFERERNFDYDTQTHKIVTKQYSYL